MTDDPLDDLLRDAAQSYNLPPDTPRDLMWARIEGARAGALIARRADRHRWLRTGAAIAAVLLVGIAIGRVTHVPPGAPGTFAVAPPPARAAAPPSSDAGDPGVEPNVDLVPAGRPADSEHGSSATLAAQEGRRGLSGRPLSGARSSYGVPPQGRGAVGDGTDMSAYRLAVVEHLARTEVLLTGFRAESRGGDTRTAGQQFAVLTRELLQNTRLLLAAHATDDPTLTRLLEDLELVLMQISQYAAEGRRGDLDAINQSLDRRNVLPKLRSTIPAGAPVPAGT